MTDACCSCEDVKKIIHDEVGKLFDAKVESLKKLMGTTKKRARAPSKYNIFMGACVKDGGNFKTCAVKWKAKKKAT